MKNYLLNLLIAFDQLANTILGGYPDETISLRSARACDNGARWGCVLCKALDKIIAPNHCVNAEINKHLSIIVRKL